MIALLLSLLITIGQLTQLHQVIPDNPYTGCDQPLPYASQCWIDLPTGEQIWLTETSSGIVAEFK